MHVPVIVTQHTERGPVCCVKLHFIIHYVWKATLHNHYIHNVSVTVSEAITPTQTHRYLDKPKPINPTQCLCGKGPIGGCQRSDCR